MATQRVHPQAPREGVNQNLRLSAQGRAELIHRERPIEHYYNDSYNCTYGIGTLAHFGRCTQEELHRHVTPDQIAISMQQGIQHAERAIRTQVTRQHLTQEQFDALVSFVYNVGSGNAAGVLSDINAGRLGAAADRMMQFTSVTERDPNGARGWIATVA